jgi:ribonucleotide reductase alpha subunit
MAAFKSNLNPMFRSKFSEDIFNHKYRHEGAETWAALAKTLVDDVMSAAEDAVTKEDKDTLEGYIRDLKFIPGGRYLYYAGRPNKFFNNCYLLRAEEDSREDWANLSWKAESCLMTGGGIGVDYSVYRAEGSPIQRTGGQASGPIPKMNMINEIGRRVMQGGSRRSAIYASLNWKHGDIDKFLKAKDWADMPVGKTGKSLWDIKQDDFNFPAPLDMTNISVNYDTEWLLKYWQTGKPGKVFEENVRQALKTAEPGFSFNFFDKERETLRNACVSGDTPILTKDGYQPIAETVGRDIEIWNGEEWAPVTPYETGESDLFRVTLSDGTHLDCTANHRWCIGGDFVETQDLLVGMKLDKFPMPVVGEVGEVDVKEAYSQGFYSGDGTTGYTRSWLYEPKFMCADGLKGRIYNDSVNTHRYVWNHGPMLDKGYVPMDESLGYKLAWLAGLLDSDGTLTRDANGSGFQIASVDHGFLNDVRLMLTTMGVRAKVVSGNKAGVRSMPDGRGGYADYNCKETKRLLIGNYDAWHLMNIGLGSFLLRIDHNGNAPQRDARQFVRVVSVEDLGVTEMTYCFTEPKTSRGTFNGIVTGQCTEVTSEDDSDVCNLGSINFGRVESIDELRDIVRLATMFLICGTLKAKLPYEKVYETREKNRRLGLGFMGVHEWLIKRGYAYDVTPELHQWLSVYKGVSDGVSKSFADRLSISRPVANRAIAPTGSIGILAGTSTGIEPIFAVAYKRRYLKGKDRWAYQYVVDSAAQELIDFYGADPENVESALDLADNYERRIKFQADVQDYVDMSISSTINLPAWGTKLNNEDTVSDFANTLASYAHRLRGFTCYPDGARGGQPLTSVPYSEAVTKLGEEFYEHVETHDICDISGTGGSCGV